MQRGLAMSAMWGKRENEVEVEVGAWMCRKYRKCLFCIKGSRTKPRMD